ncbi:hypothetical protein MUK42_15129 [Musa troglodytarum]|uniref:Uncharacterized protein n=1 Tax=Musa troglodytarum TaxID=320322 RepID=A0A9E7KX68_9LILI|nr:hypothetical protein MUK42_15129 [Musa troglodytarum]
MWGPRKSPRVVSGPRAGNRSGSNMEVGKVFFVSHVAKHDHTIHGLKNHDPADMRGTQTVGPSLKPITGRCGTVDAFSIRDSLVVSAAASPPAPQVCVELWMYYQSFFDLWLFLLLILLQQNYSAEVWMGFGTVEVLTTRTSLVVSSAASCSSECGTVDVLSIRDSFGGFFCCCFLFFLPSSALRQRSEAAP